MRRLSRLRQSSFLQHPFGEHEHLGFLLKAEFDVCHRRRRSLFSVTNTLQAVPTVFAAWNRRRWERRAVPTENLDPATLTLLVRSPT
jgi:hypothetical protein